MKVTCLTDGFDLEDFRRYYGDSAVVLFAIEPSGKLHVFSEDSQPRLRPGHCLISVIDVDQQIPREPVSETQPDGGLS